MVSILWLSYRFYSFLSLPILSIISVLQVKIPRATKISIDEVTTNSITIHWENELGNDVENLSKDNDKDKNPAVLKRRQNQRRPHISHYLVYLNNNQVAIFPNNPNRPYTRCMIGGLEQNTEYQLDLVTVNSNGFVNKVPSVYCVTKSKESQRQLQQQQQQQQQQQREGNGRSQAVLAGLASVRGNFRAKTGTTRTRLKGGKGKLKNKNKKPERLSSPRTTKQTSTGATAGNSNNLPSSNSNADSLKALENYSIDDLKKMLICAQEDLHDVIYQQTTTLNDFKDTETNLTLELDKLKSQWSQSAEFSKSVRSRIKSLEDAKLLSDLKAEKINWKVEQTRLKIKKMHNDIEAWDLAERDELDVSKLDKEYKEMELKTNEEIEELNKQLTVLHEELSEKEAENKRLGALRRNRLNFFTLDTKSSNDRNDNLVNNDVRQQQHHYPVQGSASRRTLTVLHDKTASNNSNPVSETNRLSNVLKQLNGHISEKTGLLDSAGETFIGQLNDDNPIVKEIKEQIRLDRELDQKWRDEKAMLTKNTRQLEKKLNDATHLNKQLKTGLFIQPYQRRSTELPTKMQVNAVPSFPMSTSTSTPMYLLGNSNNININNNSNNSNNNNNIIPLPLQPVLSDQLSTTLSNDTTPTNPLLLSLNIGRKDEGNSSFTSANTSHRDDFIPTVTATTSSGINAATGFQVSGMTGGVMGSAPQSLQPQLFNNGSGSQENEAVDTAFQDDDVNHLLTGLQSMMSDESENVSNYSKDFTSDQLDNFWLKRDDNHSREERLFPFASLPLTSTAGRSLSNGTNADHLPPPSSSIMASYGGGLQMQQQQPPPPPPSSSTLGLLGASSPIISGTASSLNMFPQPLPQGPLPPLQPQVQVQPQSQSLLTSSLADSSPFSEHLSLSRSGSLYRNVFDADSSVGSQRIGPISHMFGPQNPPKSQSSSRIASFTSNEDSSNSNSNGDRDGSRDIGYGINSVASHINEIQQETWSQGQGLTNAQIPALVTTNPVTTATTAMPATVSTEHSNREHIFNFMWNMGSKTKTSTTIPPAHPSDFRKKESGQPLEHSANAQLTSTSTSAPTALDIGAGHEENTGKTKSKAAGSSWSDKFLTRTRATGSIADNLSGDSKVDANVDVGIDDNNSNSSNSNSGGTEVPGTKPVNGSKMSKILPKGGVGGLFKLQTHNNTQL